MFYAPYLQKAEASIARARELFPDLPSCQVAQVETHSFTKMLYSPDHRVDQQQYAKLAESLLSIKTMRRAVQSSIDLLDRAKTTPSGMGSQQTRLAAAA